MAAETLEQLAQGAILLTGQATAETTGQHSLTGYQINEDSPNYFGNPWNLQDNSMQQFWEEWSGNPSYTNSSSSDSFTIWVTTQGSPNPTLATDTFAVHSGNNGFATVTNTPSAWLNNGTCLLTLTYSIGGTTYTSSSLAFLRGYWNDGFKQGSSTVAGEFGKFQLTLFWNQLRSMVNDIPGFGFLTISELKDWFDDNRSNLVTVTIGWLEDGGTLQTGFPDGFVSNVPNTFVEESTFEGKVTLPTDVCIPDWATGLGNPGVALGINQQGQLYNFPILEQSEVVVGEFERDASEDVVVNSGGQVIGNLSTADRIRFNEENFLITTAGSAIEEGTILVDFKADSLSLNVAIDGSPQPTINNILRFDPNGFAFDTLGSGDFQITALSGVSTTWIDGDTTYSVSAPDEVVFDEGVSIEADSTSLGDFSGIDPTSVRITYYDPNHDYTPETALQHDGVQIRFTDNDLTFPPGGYKIGDFLVVNGLTTENDTYGIGALMQTYSDTNGGFVLRRDETSFNGFFVTFQSPSPLNAPANNFATADVVTGTFSVERRRILASWDGATVDGNTGVKTINFGSSATVTPQTDTSIIDVAITAGITVEGYDPGASGTKNDVETAGVNFIDFGNADFTVEPSGSNVTIKLRQDYLTGITVEGFNSSADQNNTGITDLDFDNNHFRVAPGASGSVDITSNFTVRGENNGTAINSGGAYDLTFNVDNFNVSGSDGVVAVAWAGMDVEGNEQTGTIDTNTSGITKLDFDNDYFYVNSSGGTASIRSRFIVEGNDGSSFDQAVVDVNKIDFLNTDFIVTEGADGEAEVSLRPSSSGPQIYSHMQNNAIDTWTIVHGLDSLRPVITVYDNNDEVVVPMSIKGY